METPDFTFERRAFEHGARCIAGADEVGRGSVAGPLVAAAVVFDLGRVSEERLAGIRDSKQLSESQRSKQLAVILQHSKAWGIGNVSPQTIDQIGVSAANAMAVRRAILALGREVDHLLVDGYPCKLFPGRQEPVVRGDRKVMSIAAASILAKSWRDGHMKLLDRVWPAYGFGGHKGYGTKRHRLAIETHGPCEAHRQSWNFAGMGRPELPALARSGQMNGGPSFQSGISGSANPVSTRQTNTERALQIGFFDVELDEEKSSRPAGMPDVGEEEHVGRQIRNERDLLPPWLRGRLWARTMRDRSDVMEASLLCEDELDLGIDWDKADDKAHVDTKSHVEPSRSSDSVIHEVQTNPRLHPQSEKP